jgi:hypothetical protein
MRYSRPAMCLLEDLDAFYLEHRRCGTLDGDVQDVEPRRFQVWMACSCGGLISRTAPDSRNESNEAPKVR